MKLKSLFTPLLVGILALGIAGCSTSTTTQEIKIGATAGPHAQVAEGSTKARHPVESSRIFRLYHTR